MSNADERQSMEPVAGLQFDHAEFATDHDDDHEHDHDPEQDQAPAPPLSCAVCAEPIAESYYEVNQKFLCNGCRDGLVERLEGGSKLGRFVRAGLFGGLAALAGSGLYYLILALTGYEIALIAIVVGMMVGTAVHKGSRQRGGWVYQVLAVFLTYTAIVSSYIPLIIAEIAKNPPGQEAAAVAGNPEKKAVAPAGKGKAEAAPAPAKAAKAPVKPLPPGRAVLMLAAMLAVLMALAYAAPFMAGAQNLLGLLIIFFGLSQAWRLNRKVSLSINGPFRIESREAPAHG